MSADYPLPDWAEDCCDQIDAGFFSGDSMESPAAAARMRHYLDRWETALDEIEARRRENTNCLEGMRCPVCGSLGPYMIDGTATFEVSDEGSSEFTNLDWEDTDSCYCIECGYTGMVAAYRED